MLSRISFRSITTLNTIKPLADSRTKEKILGRGRGSGHGKTSSKGMKGQGVRGRGPYIGFESNNSSLYMRQPKIGFTNIAHKTVYAYVNLDKLQKFIEQGRIDISQTITIKTLKEAKLVNTIHDGVKLLGKGACAFKAPINIEVSAVTQKAINAIEKAGGTVKSTYYNKLGLQVLLKPEKWLDKNLPLPRRARPAPKKMDYYTDFKNRGYLSNEMQLIEKGFTNLEQCKLV